MNKNKDKDKNINTNINSNENTGIWSARFKGKLDNIANHFNSSISFLFFTIFSLLSNRSVYC